MSEEIEEGETMVVRCREQLSLNEEMVVHV
jgi:hypothetical protein